MSDYRKIAMSFKQYRSRVTDSMYVRIDDTAQDICDSMQKYLLDNDSIDTGALYDSVRKDTDFSEKGHIVCHIYADAKSPEGTEYAEFVEFGTGIHNQHGDGRTDPWKYQDRDGNWHTTSGMTARPFIRPAFAEHIGSLEKKIRDTLRIEA